jgi:hypothetical protein
MRKYFLFLCLLSNILLQGQTTDGKKQIKYLLQQIAALHIYIDYASKGYGIAKRGLHTIRDIKKGDLTLHKDFFSSLKDISPQIKNWIKVADIIAFQVQIIKESKRFQQSVKGSSQFTRDEVAYFKKIFDNLLLACSKNIDELTMVITPAEFAMTDDERIERIDRLYDDMQGKLLFAKSFSKEASLLAIQRMVDQREVDRSRKLFGF